MTSVGSTMGASGCRVRRADDGRTPLPGARRAPAVVALLTARGAPFPDGVRADVRPPPATGFLASFVACFLAAFGAAFGPTLGAAFAEGLAFAGFARAAFPGRAFGVRTFFVCFGAARFAMGAKRSAKDRKHRPPPGMATIDENKRYFDFSPPHVAGTHPSHPLPGDTEASPLSGLRTTPRTMPLGSPAAQKLIEDGLVRCLHMEHRRVQQQRPTERGRSRSEKAAGTQN